MRHLFLLAAVAVMLFSLGCERNHYQLELRPQGDQLQRRLSCWREAGNTKQLPAAELADIAKLYPQHISPESDPVQTFQGRFAGEMPSDVGGVGNYTHLTSPLGAASMYLERFRGQDDVEGLLAQRRRAAKRISTVILGWCKEEFGTEPGFEKLERFIEDDLTRDLINLSYHVYTTGAALGSAVPAGDERPTSDDVIQESLARVALYFYSRGYFTAADVPQVYRAVQTGDAKKLGELLARFIARKMGHARSGELPEGLGILQDPERLEASLEKHLRQTREYQSRHAAWRQGQTDAQAEEPQALEVWGEMALRDLLGLQFTSPSNQLEVTLTTDIRPYSSNGKWNEADKTVAWKSLDIDGPIPTVCFALWSRPDARYQVDHFGKIVLRDEQLARYCLWHESLTTDEAEQWDKLIDGLRPNPTSLRRLKDFQFRGRADTKLADAARTLILPQFEEEPTSAPESCQ